MTRHRTPRLNHTPLLKENLCADILQLTAEVWKGVTDSMNKDGDAPFLLELRSYNSEHRSIYFDKDYVRKSKGRNLWAAALANWENASRRHSGHFARQMITHALWEALKLTTLQTTCCTQATLQGNGTPSQSAEGYCQCQQSRVCDVQVLPVWISPTSLNCICNTNLVF